MKNVFVIMLPIISGILEVNKLDRSKIELNTMS